MEHILRLRTGYHSPMPSSRRRDLGIFWFLSALWSGNWLWIKIGLAGLPPFRFAGLRLALLSGLAGVAVIQGPALARTGAVTGPLAAGGLLVLTSAVVSAFSAVIVKKRLSGVSAVANVWGQSLVAAPVLLAASALFES